MTQNPPVYLVNVLGLVSLFFGRKLRISKIYAIDCLACVEFRDAVAFA
jgi:hypothetical protein